jgi:hypothetical protein
VRLCEERLQVLGPVEMRKSFAERAVAEVGEERGVGKRRTVI